jgi:energy-coupling factor transport system ATP-binding protein
LGKEEIEERVNEIAAVCGIKEFLKWPIQALSYGQKKRVTIASILVLKPSIVILDEPTAGQDFKHYSEIMNFLSYLNSLGMTFILITHDMHLMLEYAHRTIVLSSGEIIANDVPSKILTNREVIEKANLKETSLFELAERIGENPTEFVQCFIDYERNLRGKNANEIIHL